MVLGGARCGSFAAFEVEPGALGVEINSRGPHSPQAIGRDGGGLAAVLGRALSITGTLNPGDIRFRSTVLMDPETWAFREENFGGTAMAYHVWRLRLRLTEREILTVAEVGGS